MNTRGHNERSFRLDALAAEAREGLERVEQGEEFTISGWLAYGHALNEGRALFPGDREFGEWVALCQLDTADRHDRAAAMWAAANADQFEEARQRGNPRTIRGIHAKWKEIEAEREAERRRQEAEAESQSERTNREDGATGRESYAPDGSSRLSVGRTADPSDAGETVAEGEEPAAGESPAQEPEPDRSQTGDEPEPEDPAIVKLRAEFQSLTPEAQEDDWIGLRVDFAEAQKRIARQRNEIADLKAQIKLLTSDEDSGRKIGTLMRQLDQAKGRSAEHQANAARLQKQVNILKKRLTELENMGMAY